MTERPSDPELGLVIACYNEEEVLPELLGTLRDLDLGLPFVVLFIDDGSTDGTLETLREACRGDDRFACLSFSRNFGHQSAVSAGLRHVRGDIVAVLDADLQDPPAVLGDFLRAWREGSDVVYGIRQKRKESLPLRTAYRVFYRLLRRIANIPLPVDAGDFALMDRAVVDVINRMPEHNRFIRGLRGWAGFRQTGIPYDRQARRAGQPSYTLRRLTGLAFDGLMSFSAVPLRLSAWLGALSAVVGFGYLAYALVCWMRGIELPPGWTSTIIIVLFLGGIQLMMLGILGEYVGRIFDEVKDRPHYVRKAAFGWLEDAD